MEKSGGALEGKGRNKGRGLLVFIYGDALVDNTEGHNETPPPETVRLAYKEVKKGTPVSNTTPSSRARTSCLP